MQKTKTLFINDKITSTAEVFEKMGGRFVTKPLEIHKRLKNIKGFIFDWDGVFNDGIKGNEKHSDFAEADSMAVHILRYAFWKINGKMPVVAIITGQDNKSAFHFAEREHLTAIFAGYKNKFEPIEIFNKEFDLKTPELASVFDDIIDYPLAVSTALRLLIRRDASPLFSNYFIQNNLCDYITYSQQPQYPVREICELIIGLYGIYDDMLISRYTQKESYKEFWNLRQQIETKVFRFEK